MESGLVATAASGHYSSLAVIMLAQTEVYATQNGFPVKRTSESLAKPGKDLATDYADCTDVG